MRRTSLFLLISVLGCGCGSGNSLSRSQAADIIKKSSAFAAPSRFSLYPTFGQPPAEALLKEGYYTVSPQNVYQLTPKGQQTFTNLTNCSQVALPCWSFDIAYKKLVAITGVSQEPNSNMAEVDYTWEWVPNAAGRAMKSYNSPKVFACKIELQKFDDGWRATDETDGECN